MKPLISIIIANYNYGRFLETAISSVLCQCDDELRLPTGDFIELIIVDGGSSDNSIEVIKSFDDMIGWWCSEPDNGQSHAFNKGFAKAKGRFLTWLNADDVMMPGGLRVVAQKINKNPQCQWFIGSSLWLNEHMEVKRCFRAHRFSRLRAKWGTLSVGAPSSFFSKKLLDRVGGVNENFHFCMDMELWCRFYFVGGQSYKRIRKFVWGFRIHPDSKVSGLDAAPDSECALERRKAQQYEGELFMTAYKKQKQIVRFIDLISASILDWIINYRQQHLVIGKKWNEV